MRHTTMVTGTAVTGAFLAVAPPLVVAQACAPGAAQQINGNWYCNAVKQITYSHFGSTGSYNRIVDMEGGDCKAQPFDYSGALAPLDGEVSWNFRGPLNLKQFAFYLPGSDSENRDTAVTKPSPHERRQRHRHARFHQRDGKKRAVDDFVTATMDDSVVSWANEYDGGGGGQTAASPIPPAPKAVQQPSFDQNELAAAVAPAVNVGSGQWGRQAYYNAENQTADGLVFLNNMGGQGSGVFDKTLGMSLSYASADATSGSESAQILADQMLGDGDEIVIMTDNPCTDGSCGVTRPGGVAYHGFDGAEKLFLVEFDMPITGATGWNLDMPAAWILNAEIPNTIQYGRSECSCWESGCGEFDIFEVLDSGNRRCKSTIHANADRSGGDSNYFDRPVNSTVKVAVIFDPDNNAAHIVVLPDETVFGHALTDDQVADFVDKGNLSAANSLFRLGL